MPRKKLSEKIKNEAIIEIYTIRDILRWTISQFNKEKIYCGHGTDNPYDEALQLVMSILHLPPDLPIDMYDSRLTYSERSRVINMVSRRIDNRIPVPYLTNKAWFCGIEFYVDERVLIPRSPIGELINNNFNNLLSNTPPVHILDMCTGSGCLAIICSYVYPNAEIDAVDVTPSVLTVTEYNIQLHNVEDRVTPILSNLFYNLPPLKYDIIVTNPPYVDEEDMNNLPTEFHAESKLGLTAGKDGLKLIRRIIYYASEYLTKDGVLICEAGNSMIHLISQYPQVSFRWLEFNNGGHGVFMLTYHQLIKYKELFKKFHY